MSEWSNVTLKDIADFNPRESVKKGEVAVKVGMDKLQPFCRDITEIEYAEFTGGTKFRNGDTIMARITPCLENGKTAMVDVLEKDQVGFGSTEYIVFRAKKGMTDPYFLYYLVCSPTVREPAIKSMVGSSGRQRVQIDVVQNLEIKVPSLTEQKKIGDFLRKLDDKIAINNKINRNLLEQANSLFQNWFVEFKPFGGSRPEDWKEGIIDDIIEFSNGYAFKGKELLDAPDPERECYHVFKQGHIKRGGGFNITGTKSWYPKDLAVNLQKYVLHKGDVLMAMTDMKDNVAILGNTAVMEFEGEYIVNQRVALLRPKGIYGIHYPYISLLTNSYDFLKDLRSRANSGVQVNLSSNEIRNSSIYIAPESINKEFNELVMPMFEAIISNDIENLRLAELRDRLLPKLMSGELDVTDLDI